MTGSKQAVSRVPVIAGNWKMHKTSAVGASFIHDLASMIHRVKGREVVVAPPFTGLYEAVLAAQGTAISVAAQDVFWAAQGAYTGEVSADMLVGLGVRHCIIGHSERRQLFGETDENVADKMAAATAAGLVPIMCVGENEREREEGLTERVLQRQVPAGLAKISADSVEVSCIAYEPIWAIGTGRTATPEMARQAIGFVRQEVGSALGQKAAESVRILYGGSVTPENIDELMAQDGIDGVLVGGASLNVESFARIIDYQVR